MLRNLLFFGMFILFVTGNRRLFAQTLGGQTAFNFLRLPPAPQAAATGGLNIAQQSNDLSLAFQNPALLNKSMHTHTALNFNSMYAGVSNQHWMMAYYHPTLQTSFAGSIYYFNYGNITQTDAAGNIAGAFRPRDFVLQFSASKDYLEHWRLGVSMKYIASNYLMYRSRAVAMDVGLLYRDTTHLIQLAIVATNMGVQLKSYAGQMEELPFDVRIGVSKKLANAPIQFSATYHHLQQFDILYNDIEFNNANFIDNARANNGVQKFLQHLVMGAQVMIGDRVELSAGYHFLRRAELNVPNAANGLNGFGMGVGVLLPKLHIRYARSYYQNNTALNQLGITLPLNQYFGFGKWGESIGW